MATAQLDRPAEYVRKKYNKEQLAARDAELRARPFKPNPYASDALHRAMAYVALLCDARRDRMASRGQGRGLGIVSLVRRKGSMVRRAAAGKK